MSSEIAPLGVKYCGGCNPRFDRAEAVRTLGFGQAEAARPGVRYRMLLVVCGCTARCADLTGLEAGMRLLISTPEELDAALERKQRGFPGGSGGPFAASSGAAAPDGNQTKE